MIKVCCIELKGSVVVRLQEAKLKSSIAETGTQLQQVSADTEHLIEQLGEEEAWQQTAGQ